MPVLQLMTAALPRPANHSYAREVEGRPTRQQELDLMLLRQYEARRAAEQDAVLAAQRMTADNLPLAPGEWQYAAQQRAAQQAAQQAVQQAQAEQQRQALFQLSRPRYMPPAPPAADSRFDNALQRVIGALVPPQPLAPDAPAGPSMAPDIRPSLFQRMFRST